MDFKLLFYSLVASQGRIPWELWIGDKDVLSISVPSYAPGGRGRGAHESNKVYSSVSFWTWVL